MHKIRFSDETEIEVSGVSQVDETLSIQIETSDLNAVRATFKDNPDATRRMRYYVGADLIRGYAGYTKLAGIEYQPDVVQEIDYAIEDDTTESGFAETVSDVVTVKMRKSVEATTAAVSALDTRVTSVEADVQSISNALMGEEGAEW